MNRYLQLKYKYFVQKFKLSVPSKDIYSRKFGSLGGANWGHAIEQVTRGTRGTTAQPLIESGAQIFNGEESQNIALQGARDPKIANWLGQDGVSITDTTNSPTTDTIIGFIQNV